MKGLNAKQRGPITDYFGEGPEREVAGEHGPEMVRVALCVCVHGKEWPEGDLFEPEGKACRECCQQAYRERREASAA